jgi:tetratricopeptide (TPR) repeat protein
MRWLVIAGLLVASTARADEAGDLSKQALDLYKAGKYAEAAKLYDRAYQLDNKPETLFSLAQSERLSGDCKKASEHYHKVIEMVSDFNVARLVQQNLKLCGNEEDQQQPATTTTTPVQPETPVEPRIETRTVVREHNRVDALAVTMFGAGMLAIGTAGGLYLAAGANDDAADKAFTFDDHDELHDRAKTERIASAVAAGVGVALVGVAVFRWTTAKDSTSGVAIAPSTNGGSVVFSGRW